MTPGGGEVAVVMTQNLQVARKKVREGRFGNLVNNSCVGNSIPLALRLGYPEQGFKK